MRCMFQLLSIFLIPNFDQIFIYLFILQGELKIQVEQGAFQSEGPNCILGEAF